jgi:lipopolysaccharide export system protein LptC
VFAAATLFDYMGELDRTSSSAGVVVSGTKITMRQPKLAGFTKDKRPYTVTARSAAQDVTNPDVLELDQVRAVLATPTQGEVEVVARGGIYDGKGEKLSLKDDIVVTSASYVARLKEAQVGVKSGHVVSEQPVEVDIMQGKINSNRLEVIDNGAVLLFDNGVTMLIEQDDNHPTRAAKR